MTGRFPQVLSIKTGDMKAHVQALQDGMNKLTGYFNELIVEFGESKEDYTVDSFFKVLVDFYDIFMNELATLEKKKKDAEELRKRMANQEMITKSIRAHAMDTFRENTKGLTSKELANQIKKQTMRESRIRQSMAPMAPMAPAMSLGVSTRPSYGLGRQSRASGNVRDMLRESGIGLNRSYLDEVDDRRESTASYISDVMSLDTDSLAESEGDEDILVSSRRK